MQQLPCAQQLGWGRRRGKKTLLAWEIWGLNLENSGVEITPAGEDGLVRTQGGSFIFYLSVHS